MTGILLPFLIHNFFTRWNSAQLNLWIIIGCFVIAHSWPEHKEFRFLLPVLPLFCVLCGQKLQDFAKTVPSDRLNKLIVLGVLLNFTAILYLGLLHQRAPVDVNRAILRETSVKRQPLRYKQQTSYRIHYLMGCHSTPLLSHLHNPPTMFIPWYLDCSPDCRSDPTVECESDAFTRDPGGFMERFYFSERTCREESAEETCSAGTETNLQLSQYPDFIVCNAEHFGAMKAMLSTMGMYEIGRYINGVNGIRIGHLLLIGSEALSNPDFTTIELLPQFIAVSLDEIILFKRFKG
jgi:hypothetical protein